MSKPKRPRPKTVAKGVSAHQARLRGQGLRPVQHETPDVRDPRARAAYRREAALLPCHPENDAIDDWIDAAYDWSEWR